jgi:hypothetical protein
MRIGCTRSAAQSEAAEAYLFRNVEDPRAAAWLEYVLIHIKRVTDAFSANDL